MLYRPPLENTGIDVIARAPRRRDATADGSVFRRLQLEYGKNFWTIDPRVRDRLFIVGAIKRLAAERTRT